MSIELKPLQDQVIVITGASSGIGLATARAAAKGGAKVVLAARSGDTLEALARELGDAIAVVTDVSVRADVERLAARAVERFGRIDTWVNDAGLGIIGRLDEVSDADSRAMFDINFWGIVYGSLVALPYLKQQGGALINLGSEESEAVAPLQGMYAASKHAVKGFTDGLRIEIEEVDKAPVAITLIQPTAVDTPFAQHAPNYQSKESKLPTPQIEPEKVAEAILAAAVKHTRATKVGAQSKLDTFLANFVPGAADKAAAAQADRQHYDEPPRDPAGALRTPSEKTRDGAGHVNSTGGVPPKSH